MGRKSEANSEGKKTVRQHNVVSLERWKSEHAERVRELLSNPELRVQNIVQASALRQAEEKDSARPTPASLRKAHNDRVLRAAEAEAKRRERG